ncbi:MAG TPA: 3-oxoacyl-ACP reductase [Solirubrobacteraceae bacterium]|nr:3-oxoacyl-ACP reductase [Solirubrobacteraceae bacterium]
MNTLARTAMKRAGLPVPAPLERHEPGKPVARGPVLAGGAPCGRLAEPLEQVLRSVGAHVVRESEPAGDGPRFGAAIFDATGIADSPGLHRLLAFFRPAIRALAPSGRLLVLGSRPEDCEPPRERTAQRALEGFVRSAGKELRGGATAQLVQVAAGAEGAIESTLRFLLSARSAYVDGQVVWLEPPGEGTVAIPADWERALDGKVAVVTGAARGIGRAIAEVLARDGAHVVCVDVPPAGEALAAAANEISGEALQLDVTAADAPQALTEHLAERHGGLDVMVHNAGITRDKTLAGMRSELWDAVLDVNLSSQERLNDALLEGGLLRAPGRIVSVSSVSGIAGNRGQANYATSKAGVIGMVGALAPVLRARGATINAVAPGFIETDMTAAMPFATREAGRRMNSLAQGGLPVDVAETIAWMASPASGAVNGNVVRVCGQSLLGA